MIKMILDEFKVLLHHPVVPYDGLFDGLQAECDSKVPTITTSSDLLYLSSRHPPLRLHFVSLSERWLELNKLGSAISLPCTQDP